MQGKIEISILIAAVVYLSGHERCRTVKESYNSDRGRIGNAAGVARWQDLVTKPCRGARPRPELYL